MNYQDVTNYLYSLNMFGGKLGLSRVVRLLQLMGNPEKKFKSVIVGGTNGKGSTVAIIFSILREAGYKVGMFTKPHLSSFTERIIVNNKRIDEESVVKIIEEIRNKIEIMKKDLAFEHPTFFEVVIALTFRYFEQQKVDFAVLEVGMGGRLDATNVVDPLVSVITNVSLEHTKILGDTVLKIANEKAGIIKQNGILITATEDDEVFSLFKKICEEKKSKIYRVGQDITFEKLNSDISGQNFKVKSIFNDYENLYILLLGDHQLVNACCAIAAVECLRFNDIIILPDIIEKGLRTVKWPGRLEIIQEKPLVVLDSAKDPLAMRKLKDAVQKNFKYKKLILVISISSDKDIHSMLSEIVPISDFVILTRHKVMKRAANPELLSLMVEEYSKDFIVIDNVKDAVREALSRANKKDMILVTGSLFTVGEARELWYKHGDVRWGRELNEAP